MNIIKRSGKIVDFEISKIRTSIETASSDVNYPLTESDIKIIISDLLNSLNKLRGESDTTSVYEIRGLIYIILLNHNFTKVCQSYMNF